MKLNMFYRYQGKPSNMNLKVAIKVNLVTVQHHTVITYTPVMLLPNVIQPWKVATTKSTNQFNIAEETLIKQSVQQ